MSKGIVFFYFHNLCCFCCPPSNLKYRFSKPGSPDHKQLNYFLSVHFASIHSDWFCLCIVLLKGAKMPFRMPWHKLVTCILSRTLPVAFVPSFTYMTVISFKRLHLRVCCNSSLPLSHSRERLRLQRERDSDFSSQACLLSHCGLFRTEAHH